MLRFLTAGESHGKALLGIMEGVPSGLPLTVEFLMRDLRRRKLGYGRGHRQKIEDDRVEILTGVRHGQTLGSPIGLQIVNKDWRNWENIMQVEEPDPSLVIKRKVEVPRPGHADYLGGLKYDHTDLRNVLERASARETTMRVAIGAIARRLLEECGVTIASRVARINTVVDETTDLGDIATLNERTDASPVRCLDKRAEEAMCKEVDQAKKDGETLGGVIEVVAQGMPLAVGSYVQWDRRLEAAIGEAFLSMNAFKGVEMGMGFGVAATPGSKVHDAYYPGSRAGLVSQKTNRAGGIDGGMTTGQLVVVRAAMKPIATLMNPLPSVKLATNEPTEAHIERSDTCAVPAAGVIGESLLALVLANALVEKFGGDSLSELVERVQAWREKTT